MSKKMLICYTAVCVSIAIFISGCSTFGVHGNHGEPTTPGLAPIFLAGTNWHLPLNWPADSRVKGTTFQISSTGKVTVKKNNTLVPFKIENEEIVLDGVLKGCSIYAKKVETTGWVFIKGNGNETAFGKLGQFDRL